jgi:hypothetical protein
VRLGAFPHFHGIGLAVALAVDNVRVT